jgi:hypothetical protein
MFEVTTEAGRENGGKARRLRAKNQLSKHRRQMPRRQVYRVEHTLTGQIIIV